MSMPRRKGPRVNPYTGPPAPPGPWVDARRCAVCGDLYGDFRSGVDFTQAASNLRRAAVDAGDEGGGYRSRGPVLWWMRAAKLSAWYPEHAWCKLGWDHEAGQPVPMEDPTDEVARYPEVWAVGDRYAVRGWWGVNDTNNPAEPAVRVHRAIRGLPAIEVREIWHTYGTLDRPWLPAPLVWGPWRGPMVLRLSGTKTRGAFPVTILEVRWPS